ncbi:MAG: glycosyltransferase [Acidobacteriia bacterium]|nr:glycosyltransferase [Terriglobia bacterium]MBV8905729.1 glycosyltransferase [Terriglobia bacterium]
MKLVIFGLSVSSSWGNGHATIWRGLIRGLASLGHRVVFFERDQAFYAKHRDLSELADGLLILYSSWEEIRILAERHLADADVAMVTSFCPDAIAACEAVLGSPARVRCFYDLDTGITIDALRAGRAVEYVPSYGLGDFDLVLTYTGGQALRELKTRLGARHVAPLYGCVDPEVHHPAPPEERFRSDLAYLGTYSADRQAALDALFLEPARRRPDLRFVIGGPQYPGEFPWRENIFFIPHVPPAEHPAFYCSSRLTLNVTRRPMAEMGYCPSGRLFEAAACGVPIVSDEWDGLDYFFEPGLEILVARTAGHVLDALAKPEADLARLARAGRERALAVHTAQHRAMELENILEAALSLPVETAGGAQI